MNIFQVSLFLYPVQYICRSPGQCYIRDDRRYKKFYTVWSNLTVSTLIQYSLNSTVNANPDQQPLLKVEGIITEASAPKAVVFLTKKSHKTRSRKEICKKKTDCERQQCSGRKCNCRMGYSLDDELKVCRDLKGCLSFTDKFVKTLGFKLVSKTIPYSPSGPVTFANCNQACLESKVPCRAAAVHRRHGSCILYKGNSPMRFELSPLGAYYFERQCDWCP